MKQPVSNFPFVAGSYQSRSPRFDNQRTVNLYPEMSGSGNSKTIAMLIGTPGTQVWGTTQSVPGRVVSCIRGMIAFTSSRSIIVGGESVQYVDSTAAGGAGGVIGTIPNALTAVSMATNGQIVMLVTGSNGYFIDPVALTMTQIVDPAFVGADVVWFINGRFVWNRPGTQIYQWSELYSQVIDPLAFASSEGAPDLLVSLIADHKELWLMGENSTEVHINSGNPDAVFEPIQGAFMEQGCAAKYSVAKMTDGSGTGTVIMLSRNDQGQGMVVKTVGYQLQRISDPALEYQLAQYERIDDAEAYTYQMEGHSFYMVSFPTANKTWCYDTSTALWHERSSLLGNSPTAAFGRHLSKCHMFFDNKNLVGHFSSNVIYEFRLDIPIDLFPGGLQSNYLFGTPIQAIRQCPHLSADDSWQFFHELWIDMETGVGLNADITGGNFVSGGKDPSLILEWSDDGGYSFPYSREIKIGKIGERKLRAVARRLGKSKDRVFRVTITDPVKRIFLGAGCRTSVAA